MTRITNRLRSRAVVGGIAGGLALAISVGVAAGAIPDTGGVIHSKDAVTAGSVQIVRAAGPAARDIRAAVGRFRALRAPTTGVVP